MDQTRDPFRQERERQNNRVLSYAGTTLKRLWHLDAMAYNEGALDGKTKEMLGLVASLVLRCDDCIRYHTDRCHEEGMSDAEMEELVTVGMTVGGSITVPHIRRLVDRWDELQGRAESE
ncbi:carboxymuconolactone decarboxylase family protein [bacterium]|nr:carboxymuconolactone decarboxylase family protein [bacterium]